VRVSAGESWDPRLDAAVMFAQVHATALVWSNVVAFVPFVSVRAAVAFFKDDHAVFPPVTEVSAACTKASVATWVESSVVVVTVVAVVPLGRAVVPLTTVPFAA
jgi:hypothetical protein